MAVASSLAITGVDVLGGQPFTTWLVPAAMLVLRAALFVIFVVILAVLRGALDREKASARTDPLTGVSNRRHFVELTTPDLSLARRYRRPLTIAYLDLDNFKQVNDRLGHRAGDEVLRLVAGTLRSRLRVTDAVGRLGGDEFAICLPETGAEAAMTVLGQLREDVAANLPDECRFVTLSVGRDGNLRLSPGYRGRAARAHRLRALRGEAGGQEPPHPRGGPGLTRSPLRWAW